jgi:hypothetical protein
MIYGQASWYLASTEPRILHPELTRTANPRLRRLRRNLSALNPILRQIQGLQRRRHRCPRKRLSHRPSIDNGLPLHGLSLRAARLPVPPVHAPRLQLRRHLHARHHGVRVPHRAAGMPDFPNADRERGRYVLRRRCLGSGGPCEGAPGAVGGDGKGLSACTE